MGVAFGLLCGTKYTGVILGLPVAVVILCAVAWPDAAETPPRARAKLLAIAVLCAGRGRRVHLREELDDRGEPGLPGAGHAPGPEALRRLSTASRASGGGRAAEWAIEPIRFLIDRVHLFGPLFRWLILPAALLAPLLALLRPRSLAGAVEAPPDGPFRRSSTSSSCA